MKVFGCKISVFGLQPKHLIRHAIEYTREGQSRNVLLVDLLYPFCSIRLPVYVAITYQGGCHGNVSKACDEWIHNQDH